MVKLRCPYLHSFGHAPRPSTRRLYDLPGAACMVSGVYRCSVPSVRACVPCLASGTDCAAACDVQAVRVRWGLGLHLWGIWGEPGVGWSTPRVEKIQKRRFIKVVVNYHPRLSAQNTSPLLPISKISRKNKKTPTNGLCSVLYLPYKP